MAFVLDNTNRDFVVTETVGGFNYGAKKNGFDEIFTEAYNNLLAGGIDVMVDINDMMKKRTALDTFKDALLGQLATECTAMQENPEIEAGTHAYLYDQISDMFDNCIRDLVTESTRVPSLLPIKAIDFPILIKQALKLATKDIMQTEVTKQPVVKKHIQQTYVTDKKMKKRWRYPQCFFNDEFKEIYNAGKGLPIDTKAVALPIYNFDVVSELTEGKPDRDEFTMDLRIEKVFVTDPDTGAEVEVVLNTPMRINMSDNTWLGGKIKTTIVRADESTFEVDDLVTGMVDFVTKTTSVASVSGQVTAVSFSGYLSNEKNERTVGVEYQREEREWKIEDGFRTAMPYSLETLEDTKALLDIDLYKKTYNDMSDFMTQMEDSKVLEWLDEQYDKYKGVNVVDVLGWDSFVTERTFDCDSTGITTALPNAFINEMLKFTIDGLIVDICDRAKLEDMTFVIYGNPRLIRLLDPVVNWVTRPGSTSNGVKLDYGYGIMNSGDVKVQVVSTKKVNCKYDKEESVFRGLRLIPFPLSDEQFTFKHYKYTTHILTAQNSAYRDADLPGGSATYIMGTSRYTNAAIQGIQAQVMLSNAEPYVSVV